MCPVLPTSLPSHADRVCERVSDTAKSPRILCSLLFYFFLMFLLASKASMEYVCMSAWGMVMANTCVGEVTWCGYKQRITMPTPPAKSLSLRSFEAQNLNNRKKKKIKLYTRHGNQKISFKKQYFSYHSRSVTPNLFLAGPNPIQAKEHKNPDSPLQWDV